MLSKSKFCFQKANFAFKSKFCFYEKASFAFSKATLAFCNNNNNQANNTMQHHISFLPIRTLWIDCCFRNCDAVCGCWGKSKSGDCFACFGSLFCMLDGYIRPCIDHLKHTMLHTNNTNMKSADRLLLMKVQIRQVVVE